MIERENPTPIEGVRGIPFYLFPAERPIPYEIKGDSVAVEQKFHIKGLGTFSVYFGNDALKKDSVDSITDSLQEEKRTVLATATGPVIIQEGGRTGGTGQEIAKRNLLELFFIDLPEELVQQHVVLDRYAAIRQLYEAGFIEKENYAVIMLDPDRYQLQQKEFLPQIKITTPGLEIFYDQDCLIIDSFSEVAYVYPKDTDGAKIDFFLVENNEQFLRSIQIEVI